MNLQEIDNELQLARTKFSRFHSPHEGIAIIKEEFDELWKLIKSNESTSFKARNEAIQIAAMAVRYIEDLT